MCVQDWFDINGFMYLKGSMAFNVACGSDQPCNGPLMNVLHVSRIKLPTKSMCLYVAL